jgi:hypothetical protein
MAEQSVSILLPTSVHVFAHSNNVTIVIEVIAVLFRFNTNLLSVVRVLKPGYNLIDLCGSSYFETTVAGYCSAVSYYSE